MNQNGPNVSYVKPLVIAPMQAGMLQSTNDNVAVNASAGGDDDDDVDDDSDGNRNIEMQ